MDDSPSMSAAASPHTTIDALKRAIVLIGGQAAMGRLLGVSQPSVWYWVNKQKPLPSEHVLTVEEATGISRHDLRPDIYPREDLPAARNGESLEAVRP